MDHCTCQSWSITNKKIRSNSLILFYNIILDVCLVERIILTIIYLFLLSCSKFMFSYLFYFFWEVFDSRRRYLCLIYSIDITNIYFIKYIYSVYSRNLFPTRVHDSLNIIATTFILHYFCWECPRRMAIVWGSSWWRSQSSFLVELALASSSSNVVAFSSLVVMRLEGTKGISSIIFPSSEDDDRDNDEGTRLIRSLSVCFQLV
jgi:hypothetical protein